MSARPEVVSSDRFPSPNLATPAGENRGEEAIQSLATEWSPENFAREQIQALVRQVFLSKSDPPIRQVIFAAVDAETEVRRICRRVGEALAAETVGSVGVMGEFPRLIQALPTEEVSGERIRPGNTPPLRRIATREHGNLWLVPGSVRGGTGRSSASLHSYLGELRREFEYSVVEGPTYGMSADATTMAQFADGIILVLSAQHTRRATARKIKLALLGARAHLLGTVLIDRVFPVPQGLYRRL
jgi:hypothetical protein